MRSLQKDPLNLIIAGVGGQGNVVVSTLIGQALLSEGYNVTIRETYGASQRGGRVMSHIRVSLENRNSPLIPQRCADIVLGLEPAETLRILVQYGNPNVVTVVNPRPIYPIGVLGGEAEYPDMDKLTEAIRQLSTKTLVINATDEAQKLGNPIFANVILVGALTGTGLLPLDSNSLKEVLKENFPKALEINLEALRKGIELARLAQQTV